MQERRLTAIMLALRSFSEVGPARSSFCEGRITDIVGYTVLMGSDEDRAFEVLCKNREIHSNLIDQFNGTLMKEMGDGMLVS